MLDITVVDTASAGTAFRTSKFLGESLYIYIYILYTSVSYHTALHPASTPPNTHYSATFVFSSFQTSSDISPFFQFI